MMDKVLVQLDEKTLQQRWFLGWNDRGLGYGEYSIITGNDELIIGDIASGDLSQHIIDLHNTHLLRIDNNATQ